MRSDLMIDIDPSIAGQLPKNRMLRILKLLWQKFKGQSIYTKWITLLLILFTVLVIVVFFSTFIIWKILYFVFAEIFFKTLEWYLMRNKDEYS